MRAFVALILLTISLVPAGAQAPSFAGSGVMTCEAWFSSPASAQDRKKWLIDYWSAAKDPPPITRAQFEQICCTLALTELRKACERAPSKNIEEAASLLLLLARTGSIDVSDPPSTPDAKDPKP